MDRRIETAITRMASRVREFVRECIALSLSVLEDGLTFTVVSETREAALLDALQYIDGGPCVRALEVEQVCELSGEPTDERPWHLFARGQGRAGIATTLPLPVMSGGRVVCGVDLYATTPGAFEGHNRELAQDELDGRGAMPSPTRCTAGELTQNETPAKRATRGDGRTLLGDCLNDRRLGVTVLVALLHPEALLAR